MSVLVTGGTGFIGTNLCMELLNRGFDVKIFTRGIRSLNFGTKNNPRLVVGGLCRLGDVKKSLVDIDTIYHLAAYVPRHATGYITHNLLKTNSFGTLNLLGAARMMDVDKIVYSSTQAVYGRSDHNSIEEDHPKCPRSLYGISKRSGELYCEYYKEKHEMTIQILRYSFVYGPHQPGSGVVTKFLLSAMKNEPITIYGDGSQFRDFVYVKDVVDANLLCSQKTHGGAYNIGSGEKLTIKELAETAIALTNSKSKIIFKPTDTEERGIYLNIEKARKELGYCPSSPRQGLSDYVEWLKNNV